MTAALGCALAFAFPSSLLAAEADYIQRYEGSFTGSGTVRLESLGRSIPVTCSLTGRAGAATITMSGTCRAAIFSRRLGASLKASGMRYSGQYTGSKNGAAGLSGRRAGDAVTLAVTWPKPVYGDRKATMTLSNSGAGGFTFRVVDRVDGKPVTTTDLRFRRR